MSLKFSDGTTKTNVATQIYPLAGATVAYTAGKGAFGVPALDCPQNIVCPLQLGAQFVTIFHNFWFQTPVPGAAGTIWQAFDSVAAAVQVSLQINASGQLQLFRGATLLATYSSPLAPNTLYHLEIKTIIDPSAGLCQVRLNGNTTPVLTFSGNTRSTANTFTDQTRFGPTTNNAATHYYYSHIFIFDNIGTSPNDWVGMKRIYTQMPTADSATGGLNAFASSPSQGGGAHFNNVKETPPDDDTSYNSDGTATDRESYRVAGLPSAIVNIVDVNVFVRMRIDDAGPHAVNIVARNGSSDTVGPAQSQAASYLYYSQDFPLDPNTSAPWTAAVFGTGSNSNAEFGPEIMALAVASPKNATPS